MHVTHTMSVSISGTLIRHEWLPADASNSILGEDAFSLIVARSRALGWADFSGSEPPTVRWGHNDAGGDWTGDGRLQQLAWFQLAVPEPHDRRRLPVLPVLSLIDDMLSLVGSHRTATVNLILPIAAAVDAREEILSLETWLRFAAPTDRATVTVVVAGSSDIDWSAILLRAAELGASIARRFEPNQRPAWAQPYGESWLLPTGSRAGGDFQVTLPAWSPAAVSWLSDLIVQALFERGHAEPVTVSMTTATQPASS